MDYKETEIAHLQSQLRNQAVKAGKNPDTLFALRDAKTIDIQGVLAVLAYDGPEVIVKSIDQFIFTFLEVLSTASSDNGFHKDMWRDMWIIKRLRDAILHGMPNGYPLGDSDYKDEPFTM